MHFLDIDIYKVIYLNDSYYICNTNVIVYFPCMKLEEAQITKMQTMHKRGKDAKRKRCKTVIELQISCTQLRSALNIR